MAVTNDFTGSTLNLNGQASFTNPTALDWGPDGRLYVTQQKGDVVALSVAFGDVDSDTVQEFYVTASETVPGIQSIPNFDDDGEGAGGQRQVTGITTGKQYAANGEEILIEGKPAVVLYVTSSDARIGAGGGGGDTGLDTNSGVITRLVQTETGWEVTDIVRGLARSEENHSLNGLELIQEFDDQGNLTERLIVTNGGNANTGAPSNNFAGQQETAYSAAILEVDLDQIKTIEADGEIKTDNGRNYVYDVPTLDDPTQPGSDDVNDPFGGNDGFNQGILTADGPVQIYSAGYRNAYDVEVTEDGRVWTYDNGANNNWGGRPAGEDSDGDTNSTEAAELNGPPDGYIATNLAVNDNAEIEGNFDPQNWDQFHEVTRSDDLEGRVLSAGQGGAQLYTWEHPDFGTLELVYGGHPNPTRAEGARAGLLYSPESGITNSKLLVSNADKGNGSSDFLEVIFWLKSIGYTDAYLLDNVVAVEPGVTYADQFVDNYTALPTTAGVYSLVEDANGPIGLPADIDTIVNALNPIEGDYQEAGFTDGALDTGKGSINGLAEYTSSIFDDEDNGVQMKGAIIAASLNQGQLYVLGRDADGVMQTTTTNGRTIAADRDFIGPDIVDGAPLGLASIGDDLTPHNNVEAFRGTIWSAVYKNNGPFIQVLQPGNPDTNPLLPAYAGSEVTDPTDADLDGLENTSDPFDFSPTNGLDLAAGQSLILDFNQTDLRFPGTLGDTGLLGAMLDGVTPNADAQSVLDGFAPADVVDGLFDNAGNLILGANAPILNYKNVQPGTAVGTANSGRDMLQTGLNLNADVQRVEVVVDTVNWLRAYAADGRLTGVTFSDGTQFNFVRFAYGDIGGGQIGFEIGLEVDDSYTSQTIEAPQAFLDALTAGAPAEVLDEKIVQLGLNIDVDDYTVQASYRIVGETPWTDVGAAVTLPENTSLRAVLDGTHTITDIDGTTADSGAGVGVFAEDNGSSGDFATDFPNIRIFGIGNEIEASTVAEAQAPGTDGVDTVIYDGTQDGEITLDPTVENFVGSGSSADYGITGNAADNVITVGSGTNTIATGNGADEVRGTLADLGGDTFTDFSTSDKVVITDRNTANIGIVEYDAGSAEVIIDGATLTFDSPDFDDFNPADGPATFQFVNGDNGLEITLVPDETLVQAINAGSNSYTYFFDAAGNVVDQSDPNAVRFIEFQADEGGGAPAAQFVTAGSDGDGGSKIYSGGNNTQVQAIQGNDYGVNALDELHWNERSSNQAYYGYEIPVADGNYRVDIYLAEIFHGLASAGSTGSRTFDIEIEGTLVEDNFTLDADDAGIEQILSYEFSVADGAFTIDFDARSSAGGTDQPKISALALYEIGGTFTPPADTTAPVIVSIDVANPANDQDSPRLMTVELSDNAGFDQAALGALDGSELSFTDIVPESVSAPAVTLANGGTTATLVYTLQPPAGNSWPQTTLGEVTIAAGAYADSEGNTSAAASQTFASTPNIGNLTAKGNVVFAVNVGPTTNSVDTALPGNDQNTYGGAIDNDPIIGVDLQVDDPSWYSPSSKTGSNIDGKAAPEFNTDLDGSALHTYRDSANEDMTATYPVPNGIYVVELWFAELFHATGGNRQGDYTINGEVLATDFDAFNAAGGADTQTVLTKTVVVTDGQLVVDVQADSGQPGWNAIVVYEALPADTPPTISVEDVSAVEGGAAEAVFTRTGDTTEAVEVTFTVTPNAPASTDDFDDPTSFTATIPAGAVSSAPVTIPIVDDSEEEGAETLTVEVTGLSNTSNDAVGVGATGTVTIAASDQSFAVPVGNTILELDFETPGDPLIEGGFDGLLGGSGAADPAGNPVIVDGELQLTTSNGDLSQGPADASKNDFIKAVDISDPALTEVYLTTRFDNPFSAGQPNFIQQGILIATGDTATQQDPQQFQKLIVGGNNGDAAQIWSQGPSGTAAVPLVSAMSNAAVADGGSAFTFDNIASVELSMRFDKVTDETGIFVTFFDDAGEVLGGVRPEATPGFLTVAPVPTPPDVVAAIDNGTSVVGVTSTDFNAPPPFLASWDFLTVSSPQFSDTPVEDTDGPTATVTLAAPDSDSDPIVATVVYSDASDIDQASIDAADVTLAGPSTPGAVTLTSFDDATNTAIYSIAAPTGGWAEGDYTATVTSGQIADLAGTPNTNAGGETGGVTLAFDDDPIDTFTPGAIIRAVNVGGPAITADPVLGIDLEADDTSIINPNGTVYIDGGSGGDATGDASNLDGSALETERFGTTLTLNMANPDGSPLENGTYFVEVHLAELFQDTDGVRVFDVSIEGELVADNLDLNATAGASQPFVISQAVEVSDGQATVVLDASTGVGGSDNAKIGALVIREAIPTTSDTLVSISGPGDVVENGDGTAQGTDQSLVFTLTAADGFTGTLDLTLDVDGTTEQLTGVAFTSGVATYEVAVPTDTRWNDSESVSVTLVSVETAGYAADTAANAATGTLIEDDPADSYDLDGDGPDAPIVVGDFSGEHLAPTDIGTLAEGTTEIVASQQGDFAAGGRERDYITFTVADGQVLSGIVVKSYVGGEASSVSQGFMAIAQGSQVPLSQAEFEGNFPNGTGLLGGYIYSGSDVAGVAGSDGNVLDELGDGEEQGYTFPGFDGPLPAGTYTLWLNQGSDNPSTVILDLITEPASVPEIVLSIADATVVEGDGATLDFAVTADSAFSGTLEITYDSGGETGLTQSVAFTDGVGTLSVPVVNDDVNDGPDTVQVTLTDATDTAATDPVTVTLADVTATGTVTEDDGVDPLDIDGDGILNTDDPFAYDPSNGDDKVLVPGGEFTQDFNTATDDPFSPEGGFTGILVNPAFDYGNPADPAADPYGNRTNEGDVDIAGGTLNILSTETDTFPTSGTGNNNTLADGYQSAVDVSGTDQFEVHARASSADWLASTSANGFSQFGISLGAGGVDDFVKVVLSDNGGNGGSQAPTQRVQLAHNNSLMGGEQNFTVDGNNGPSVDLTLVGDIEFRLIVDRTAGANGQVTGQVDFFASEDGALLETFVTPATDILANSSLLAAMDGQNPLTGGDGGLAYGVFVTDWQAGASNRITANYDFLTVRSLDTPPANVPPTADPIDAGSVDETAGLVAIDLLGDANAADSDGGTLAIDPDSITVVDTANGDAPVAFILDADGQTLNIDPAQFAAALDSGESASILVSYDVLDGQGGVTPNTANLVVNGVDAATVAISGTPSVVEDGDDGTTTTLQFDLAYTGGADETRQLTYTVNGGPVQSQSIVFSGGVGTLAVSVDNDDLANGPDTVTVLLTGIGNNVEDEVDSAGDTATGTVTEDDFAPVAVADAASVLPGGTVTFNPAANDTDVDNLATELTVKEIDTTATSGGTVTLANGEVTVTADATSTGDIVFGYTVADPAGNEATGTATVTVGALTLVAIAATASAVEAGDDGDTIVNFVITTSPAATGDVAVAYTVDGGTTVNATVTLDANGEGTLSAAVPGNDNVADGDDTVTVSLTDVTTAGFALDINNASGTATISEDDFAPVFDPAVPAAVDVAENTTAVIDVDATDANNDDVTYSLGGADANAFTIDAATGAIAFAAAQDFEQLGGDTSFDIDVTATAADGSVTTTLTVNVTDVEENVVVDDETEVTVTEDTGSLDLGTPGTATKVTVSAEDIGTVPVTNFGEEDEIVITDATVDDGVTPSIVSVSEGSTIYGIDTSGDDQAEIEITLADRVFTDASTEDATVSVDTEGNIVFKLAPEQPSTGLEIVFDQDDVSAYSGSQDAGTAIVSGDGTSITLDGNAWKKIALAEPVTIQQGQELRFTVSSNKIGEILTIGFDGNDDFRDEATSIQFGGRDAVPAFFLQSAVRYETAGTTQAFSLSTDNLAGKTFTHLVIVSDDDANGGQNGNDLTISDVRLVDPSEANLDPVAVDETITVNDTGGAITLDPLTLLENDFDPDGDVVFISAVDGANGGSVSLEDGLLSFDFDDSGAPASFEYTVTDGNGGAATATASLNRAPQVTGESFSTDEGTPLFLSLNQLLEGDTDPDGDQLTLTAVNGAVGGTVQLDDEGQITFTPASGFTGQGSFTYTVSDGRGGETIGSVSVTVGEGGDDERQTLDFTTLAIQSYNSNDDLGGNTTATSNALTLTENSWKRVQVPTFTVEEGTELVFTIDASDAGEILAVGLENNNTAQDSNQVIFQVGGTQNWARSEKIEPSYQAGEGPRQYVVKLDEFEQAAGNTFNSFVFIADDDADSSANVTFSDVSVGKPLAPNEVTIVATTDAAEPDADGQFTISLASEAVTDTVVSYTVAGSATAGDDYTALSGTVTIDAGQTTATIDVSVIDDLAIEGAEDVVVTLTGATGDANIALGATTAATVSIADDDVENTVSIAATTDGAEPATSGVFTVSLATAAATDTVVSYTVAGSATAGDDYTALSGTVTIDAGQTTATIDVSVIDDLAIEGAEDVVVTLTGATGDANIALGAITAATVSIADDDVENTVSIAATTDGAEPDTNGVFTVSLATAAATDTVVSYTVAGSATAGTDYTALTGTVTIPQGDTSATIDISVIDDTEIEGVEDVTVTLTSAMGDANIALGTETAATISIADDDQDGGTGTPEVLLRINAFGPQVAATDGGPDWSEDTNTNPSEFYSIGQNRGDAEGTNTQIIEPNLPGIPNDIFLTQRSDNNPFSYNIDLADIGGENGDYQVNLYFGEVFDGNNVPEERAFDVSLEGQPATGDLNNLDVAEFFNQGGGVISQTVNVDDGVLNILFQQIGVDNPVVSGIEVIELNGSNGGGGTDPDTLVALAAAASATEDGDSGTTTVDFVLTTSPAAANATIDVGFTVDGVATSQSVTLDANGAGTLSVDVSGFNDDEDDGDDTAAVVLTGITTDGFAVDTANATGTATIVEDDTDTSGGEAQVLLRINAGGSEVLVDGELPWTQDLPVNVSGLAETGSGDVSTSSQFLQPITPLAQNRGDAFGYQTDPSTIPAGVPEDVLDSARSSNVPFTYSIPVSALGNVSDLTVRLYLAELFGGNSADNNRVFDVTVEGQTPSIFDDIDLADDGDAFAAEVREFDVTVTDGTLDLTFTQDVSDNPVINGIEILSQGGGVDPTVPAVSIGNAAPVQEGGDTGTTTLTFPVTFSSTPDAAVSVDYVTSLGGGTQTAVIQPGGGSITVDVDNDDIANGPDTVTVTLTGATGATLAGTTATGSVTEDDFDGVIGAATLSINENSNNVQISNFGSDSFLITNVGDKNIAKLEIDVTDALYPDAVFDPFGNAGDLASKDLEYNSGASATGAIAPNNNENDSNNETYVGLGGTSGYEGIVIEFTDFDPSESLGFAVDMDPNSIAGSAKGTLDSGANPNWDVGGISGAELIGSTFTVTFEDGTTATGQLQGVGNNGGSKGLASQASPQLAVSLTVNGVGAGGEGIYSDGGPQVIINGPAGETARIVLTKGIIQPTENNFTGSFGAQLDAQLAALEASGFPANNAAFFQTVDVTLTGGNQDISSLFNFTDVPGIDLDGNGHGPEDELPLGFAAAVIDPANDDLPKGPVTSPIHVVFDDDGVAPTATLSVSADNLTVEESGDSGNTSVTFTVSASGPLSGDVEVAYALTVGGVTTNETATLNFDGANPTITVEVPNDDAFNGPETVSVQLTGTDATDVNVSSAVATSSVTEDEVAPPAPGAFIEQNGLVVIEMESANSLPGNWNTVSDYDTSFSPDVNNPDAATGDDFIVWQAGQFFGSPGNGLIEYEVQINDEGTYRFQWRSQVGNGTNTTEHNDTWLKIEADQFYGAKGTNPFNTSSIVQPKGAADGTFPDGADLPEGAGSNGWFKIYSSGANNWSWSTNTSDNDAHQIYAQFDNPGTYTIQVSARSSSHAIDRMVLSKVGDVSVQQAQNLNNPESPRVIDATDTAPTVVDEIDDVSLFEGASTTVNAAAAFNDLDGDDLDFTLTGAPNGVSINEETGQITIGDGVALGSYDLTVTAEDDDGNDVSDTFTLTVSEQPDLPDELRFPVLAGIDDFEQFGGFSSNDFELGFNAGQNQYAAVRFDGVTISDPSQITEAFIEFEAEGSNGNEANFLIEIENSETVEVYPNADAIPARSYLNNTVDWADVEAWTVGETYRTPDLTALIQEVIGNDGVNDGALAFQFTATAGNGTRSAYSFENAGGNAPVLVIRTSDDPVDPVNQAPSVSLSATSFAVDEGDSTRTKVADISIIDDGVGTNALSLAGADASAFEIDGDELFLKAGVTLNPGTLSVDVEVDDAAVGGSPDDTAQFTLTVNDVDDPQPTDGPLTFAVLDNGKSEVDALLEDGDSYDLGALGGSVEFTGLSSNASVDSVVLQVTDANGDPVGDEQLENLSPWDITVVLNGVAAGDYTLTATSYSGPNGEGTVLGTQSFDFSLTDGGGGTQTPELIGEAGVANFDQDATDQWFTVSFTETLSDPVVVLGPTVGGGDEPNTMRVREITNDGFQFQLDEWDYLDGAHAVASVGWLAIESGTHTIDGQTVIAGLTNTNGGSIGFDQSLSNPVVFAQVASDNEAEAVTDRIDNVTMTGFDVALDREEANTQPHGSETLAWIAFEDGNLTGNVVDHVPSSGDITFGNGFGNEGDVFIADMQTEDGGDPSVVRLDALTDGGAGVSIEEETSSDAEVVHTTENVGWAAFLSGQIFDDGIV